MTPIFVVMPFETVTVFSVTGLKGNAGIMVIEYIPVGKPANINFPSAFTPDEYEDVPLAVTYAEVPAGEV